MLLISHRGAKGLAPENTIEAIKIAAKLGVSYIEFDVQRTKDNQAIVFHDRLTALGRQVHEQSLKEIQKQHHKAATLSQALIACGNSTPLVELKSAGIAEIALPLFKKHPEATATSFIVKEINFLSSHLPNRKLFLMQRKHPFGLIKKAKAAGVAGIGINKNWMLKLPYYYWQAKRNNLIIYTYTVNSPFIATILSKTMPKLLICTDNPDKIKKNSKDLQLIYLLVTILAILLLIKIVWRLIWRFT